MKIFSTIGITLLALLALSCNNSKTPVTAAPVNNSATKTPFSPTDPTAESFTEAKAHGLDFDKVDSVYISGINVDTNKAVFKGRTHEFITAYREMLFDFAHDLQKNESFATKSFQFFNRVYFQSNGTIDYFFYNIKFGVLTTDEEATFKKSLNEFIKTYKFPMTASVPFAQCAPVTIQAPNL